MKCVIGSRYWCSRYYINVSINVRYIDAYISIGQIARTYVERTLDYYLLYLVGRSYVLQIAHWVIKLVHS